ncbi:MAG: glycosyltransferase [Candidatus Acidiferrales bacterium]
MVDSPKITVILCTHNRARTLATALESIAAQNVPHSVGWEIVVVDNNSSDDTRQVVEDIQRRYPNRFRYFFERQQGLSHARNAGIREARGEILAFIDDDETAASDWLHSLTVNLYNGEWSGAGGRILPQWNCDRPKWLSDQSAFALAPLAVFDLGTQAGPLTESPFGANMAFRKEVFDACGGFRTDLGRIGKGMLSGEDSEFGRRVLAAGRRLRYEPSAVTYHPVEEFRIRRKYFLEWWFNKGRSDVREFGNQAKKVHFLGIPLRLFRGFVAESLRWMVAVESTHRFICKLKVWACAGQISEHYHQSLAAKSELAERSAKLSPPAKDGR